MPKSLNRNGNGLRLPATVIKPGDYPLGSLESRVAARALALQERQPPVLSPYDQDALTLYCGMWAPNREALEMTAIYQRGRELHELEVGPTLPAHLDEHCKRCTFASLAFEEVHGREPKTGEVLRFSDVQAIHNPEVYEAWFQHFADAWSRQFPAVPLRNKLECGRQFTLRPDGVWEAYEDAFLSSLMDPQRVWCWIERELRLPEAPAFGSEELRAQDMPTIRAVVFLGVQDGKHRCKPATGEEAW